MTATGDRWGRGVEGQAAVELALVLPLVAAVLLAIVQVGLLVRDEVLVVHAAREAAREAAVEAAAGAPRQAAVAGSGLEANRLQVDVSGRGAAGSRVRVNVRYRAPTDVPLVGAAVGDVTLQASATMRVEH
ncbi:MAG: TadE family protein [Acidimicrobiales bacterium]